jgi:hypothetical protein
MRLAVDGMRATALSVSMHAGLCLVVHPAQAAARHRRVGCFLLRPLGDHRLGRDQKTSDRGRSLQSAAHDLRWVNNTLAYEITIFTRLRVVPETIVRVVQDLERVQLSVLRKGGKVRQALLPELEGPSTGSCRA